MAGSSGLGSAGAQRSAGIGGGAAAGASNAGVGGTGPTVAGAGGASAVPATFETFKFVITQTPCFGAGCHNDAQNPLNLRADDLLYKRVSSHISKNCGNLPIVNPGKPQESALIKILKGPCAPTPRMPVGCVDDEDAKCIPSDYIAAIAQWIANGAKEQ